MNATQRAEIRAIIESEIEEREDKTSDYGAEVENAREPEAISFNIVPEVAELLGIDYDKARPIAEREVVEFFAEEVGGWRAIQERIGDTGREDTEEGARLVVLSTSDTSLILDAVGDLEREALNNAEDEAKARIDQEGA